MKKLIALVLCGMMMVGALCAFAAEGIMPRIDCDHSYGTTADLVDTDTIGCIEIGYYEVTCNSCGACVRTYSRTLATHHEWDGNNVCKNCGIQK